MLLERVFPKIRLHCFEHGYDFQAIDITWGIKSLILDEHNITRLTLDLLHYCQEQSIGPNFIVSLAMNSIQSSDNTIIID